MPQRNTLFSPDSNSAPDLSWIKFGGANLRLSDISERRRLQRRHVCSQPGGGGAYARCCPGGGGTGQISSGADQQRGTCPPPLSRPAHPNVSFHPESLLTFNKCSSSSKLHSKGLRAEDAPPSGPLKYPPRSWSLERRPAGPNLWKYGWLSTADPLPHSLLAWEGAADKHAQESWCNHLSSNPPRNGIKGRELLQNH